MPRGISSQGNRSRHGRWQGCWPWPPAGPSPLPSSSPMFEMSDLEQERAIGVVSPSARFDRVVMCGSRRNHSFSMGSMLAKMVPTCVVFLLGGVAYGPSSLDKPTSSLLQRPPFHDVFLSGVHLMSRYLGSSRAFLSPAMYLVVTLASFRRQTTWCARSSQDQGVAGIGVLQVGCQRYSLVKLHWVWLSVASEALSGGSKCRA